MPANLSQEAKGKWNKVIEAKNPKAKLAALQEFLSSVPKHKGNEKLRMHIKSKIADLKNQIEVKKTQKIKGIKEKTLEKAGEALILIVGLTNVGKSSLLKKLTNTHPKISGYPYTTVKPIPGIMYFEDISFQLIEFPSLIFTEQQHSSIDLIKKADLLIILLDITQNIEKQLESILLKLEKVGVTLTLPNFSIEVDYNTKGIVIQSTGNLLNCTLKDIRQLVTQYGFKNIKLILKGEIRIDDIEESILESKKIFKPSLVLLNKFDEPVRINIEVIGKLIPNSQWKQISCKSGVGLDGLSKLIFDNLNMIRIYTKEPREKENSNKPFTMKKGSKIADITKMIHSDLLKQFKYAKIWGTTAKYPGEKVGLTHELADKDVVEIH